MARARSIKPGFFTNDKLAELSPLARILFAGLWTLADREGRLEDRPARIRAAVLPYDNCRPDALLSDLDQAGFILRYEVGGVKFISIPSWHIHQNPHHMEPPSDIPAPDGVSNRYTHKPLSPKQRARIYARDGRKCKLCGATENLQIDHIVPISSGGSSCDDNLRTLCGQCNNKRSKAPPKRDFVASDRADSLNPVTDSLNPEPCTIARNGSALLTRYSEIVEAWQKPCECCGMVFPCNDIELGYSGFSHLVERGAITEENITHVFEGLRRWRGSRDWHKADGRYVFAMSTFFGVSKNGIPKAPRYTDQPAQEGV